MSMNAIASASSWQMETSAAPWIRLQKVQSGACRCWAVIGTSGGAPTIEQNRCHGPSGALDSITSGMATQTRAERRTAPAELTRDQLVGAYRTMLLARRLDDKEIQLKSQ